MFSDLISFASHLQTVIKISANILDNPSDPKYRTIKAASKTLKNNIIDIKGGQELFVAVRFSLFLSSEGVRTVSSSGLSFSLVVSVFQLGFRTKVIEFIESWTFPIESNLGGLDRLDVLQIGVGLLKIKEVETKKR